MIARVTRWHNCPSCGRPSVRDPREPVCEAAYDPCGQEAVEAAQRQVGVRPTRRLVEAE